MGNETAGWIGRGKDWRSCFFSSTCCLHNCRNRKIEIELDPPFGCHVSADLSIILLIHLCYVSSSLLFFNPLSSYPCMFSPPPPTPPTPGLFQATESVMKKSLCPPPPFPSVKYSSVLFFEINLTFYCSTFKFKFNSHICKSI